MHNCSMCPFFSVEVDELVHHFTTKHRNSTNFIIHCSAVGCGVSFNSLRQFQKHCSRQHQNILLNQEELEDNDVIVQDNDVILQDNVVNEDQNVNELTFCEAQFILKLKNEHNLSQRAIEDIIISTKFVLKQYSNVTKNQLHAHLNNGTLNAAILDESFGGEPFEGLETEYLQEKFFEKNLSYVKPCAVKLGEENVIRKVGNKQRFVSQELVGYYVPFLDQLKNLLSLPEVKDCLSVPVNERDHGGVEFVDFFSGQYFQKEYYRNHPNALLFCLYYDDFEICNPIGSHRKKLKLSIFYWSLLNIEPELRFKVHAIQLLAVAKSSHIKKFGISSLLSDFISGLKKLHKGHQILPDEDKLYYGSLYCVLGDTPAAQFIGGFKEGVSFAHKPCRTCEITQENLRESLTGDEFPLRNELEHKDRCHSLSELTGDTKKYWSKHYGINSASVLLDLADYEVTQTILHDPMHVLLEGLVKLELKLMLCDFIDKSKYFTIRELNCIIRNFSYGDFSTDKPQELDIKCLQEGSTCTISMTAIETLNFMTLLPFMIGHLVPEVDGKWKNFIRLIQITFLVISPYASCDSVQSLKQLIYTHNFNFLELYPHRSATPKLHYLTHFPRQILLFGPGRNHWCLRFEAKHGLFKLKKWRNFKCLQKSVSFYHQRWMALKQIGSIQFKPDNYLYKGDTVSAGVGLDKEVLPEQFVAYIEQSENRLTDSVLSTQRVCIHGNVYHNGSVLLLSYDGQSEPVFGIIKNIFVMDNVKYFYCESLEIIQFHVHFNSFECGITDRYSVVSYGQLKYKWPQVSQRVHNAMHVMLRNVDFNWS